MLDRDLDDIVLLNFLRSRSEAKCTPRIFQRSLKGTSIVPYIRHPIHFNYAKIRRAFFFSMAIRKKFRRIKENECD